MSSQEASGLYPPFFSPGLLEVLGSVDAFHKPEVQDRAAAFAWRHDEPEAFEVKRLTVSTPESSSCHMREAQEKSFGSCRIWFTFLMIEASHSLKTRVDEG